MNSVLFKNKGLIDLDFIRSFGVSVKENDSPIGFFGTGLKYAIAILLRENQEVTLFLGEDEYKFTTTEKIKRGKSFDFVTMNDEVLGYTTELGKNWDLWQAFRELYSNCKDEGGDMFQSDPATEKEQNCTIIAVEGRDFESWFINRDKIVLSTEPLCKTATADIHHKDVGTIFYKGIRVKHEAGALFDYNINKHIDLTEDRTVAWTYEVNERIASAFLLCRDMDLIRIALTAGTNDFEKGLSFCSRPETPTPEFVKVVEDIVAMGITNINASALEKCAELSENLRPTRCELSKIQKTQLKKSVHILDRMGYQINIYPIMVVEELGNGCLGMAKNNTIYIAKRTFHMGTKQVVATIFEEYLHLRHKLKDNTYEMQNFLFDIIFTNAENYILEEAI